MNETEFEKLREASWRRKLSAQEEAALKTYVANHTETQIQFDEEIALSGLLGALSDAPVSSNFTAQVLQTVERHARSTESRGVGKFSWLKLNWLPRIAVTCLLVSVGLISVSQYRKFHRNQIAQDVATVSSAASVPQQWLEDFDAISRLSQPPVDHELLAALQ